LLFAEVADVSAELSMSSSGRRRPLKLPPFEPEKRG
jgi:hypothetical protein